jgi:hypothetical protein
MPWGRGALERMADRREEGSQDGMLGGVDNGRTWVSYRKRRSSKTLTRRMVYTSYAPHTHAQSKVRDDTLEGGDEDGRSSAGKCRTEASVTIEVPNR